MSGAQGTQAVSTSERHDVAHLRLALASLAGSDGRPVDATRMFDALHGEMSAEEKHGWKPGDPQALSHRARAFKLFAETGLAERRTA